MNMKKIFIILFCVLGMATSCNFLDVIPSGKATEDDLFKTHVQADNFAASLYYYMPNRWYFQSSLEMCDHRTKRMALVAHQALFSYRIDLLLVMPAQKANEIDR